jgi:sensor domain CHASE-containing protein
MQVLRDEVDVNISKVRIELTQLVNTMMERMQAEAERRAETMLQKLTQMLKIAPKTHIDRAAPVVDTESASGLSIRASGSQGQKQPMRAAQPCWAAVTGTGAQNLRG